MSAAPKLPKLLLTVPVGGDGFEGQEINVYDTSVCFDRYNRAGEYHDGFELTWEEIYYACRRYHKEGAR